MIYHCTLFKLKPEVSQAEIDATLASMREQGAGDPNVEFRTIGPVFGSEFQYGTVSGIRDIDAYSAMMNDPAHLERDRTGLPMLEKFASYDIADDPDPEIGAKIAEVHRLRFEEQPDIARLVLGIDYTGSAAPGKDEG
ncbi:hypothetical protein GCM10027570_07530 [Streptomonospora sediminis]